MDNSRFKFRAWDNKEKCMMYPCSIHFNSGNSVAYMIDDYMRERRDLILMQYTGLTDKKGKEIYEGDILNIGEEHHKSKEIVCFENGCFGIKASWWKNDFIPLKEYCNDVFIGYVEIIGNIYENPELIEGRICQI